MLGLTINEPVEPAPRALRIITSFLRCNMDVFRAGPPRRGGPSPAMIPRRVGGHTHTTNVERLVPDTRALATLPHSSLTRRSLAPGTAGRSPRRVG
eukprot:m.295864 g.295864  ORF g.295864 m.295864 type:complete len:96 (-) comp27186_c0_seq1:150-437(-)